jgi:hypothetical protein
LWTVLRFYIVLVNVAIFLVPFACAFLKLILYDMDFLFKIVLIYAELSYILPVTWWHTILQSIETTLVSTCKKT